MSKPTVHYGSFDELAANFLKNSDSVHVVLGPHASRQYDGETIWSVIVATSQRGRGFFCDEIVCDGEDRRELIFALARHRPIVLHVMDDELAMARLCEQLWPCEKTTRIRNGVEAECEAKTATKN